MGLRWDDPRGLGIGRNIRDVTPDHTRRSMAELVAAADQYAAHKRDELRRPGAEPVAGFVPPISGQGHTATPYYRGVAGVRWWRCQCGQVIVRNRPLPYIPRHA